MNDNQSDDNESTASSCTSVLNQTLRIQLITNCINCRANKSTRNMALSRLEIPTFFNQVAHGVEEKGSDDALQSIQQGMHVVNHLLIV